MRELAAAATLLVALAVAAIAPKIWPDDPRAVLGPGGSAAPTPASSGTQSWRGKDGGAGFVVCGSSETWSRPTIAEENAHLAADSRYRGTRVDDISSAAQQFRASAVLYDGAGSSTRAGLVMITGLWSDPDLGHEGCSSAEPQVWLFGYEPVSYRGGWPGLGELSVRKKPGYRMVVLTGQLGSDLVLVDAYGKVTVLDTRAWIGPTPTPAPKAIPTSVAVPAPASTFPIADRPLELVLPNACRILASSRHDDGLGAAWTVQCGSAQANLAVAVAAVKQGWARLEGPPIGVGLQNYKKGTLSMQLAYRLDGPAYSDPFQLVQYSRPFEAGAESVRPNPNAYLRVPTGFDLPAGCAWGEAPAGFTSDGAYRIPFRCPGIKPDQIQAAFTYAIESQGWHVDNGGFGFLTYAKDGLRLTATFANANAEPSESPWVVESLCCFAP